MTGGWLKQAGRKVEAGSVNPVGGGGGSGWKRHAVILNGVLPGAKAGAKRSEESLTLRGRRRWE